MSELAPIVTAAAATSHDDVILLPTRPDQITAVLTFKMSFARDGGRDRLVNDKEDHFSMICLTCLSLPHFLIGPRNPSGWSLCHFGFITTSFQMGNRVLR